MPSTSVSTELENDAQGLPQTAKDLIAGAAGGVAQVIIGQPFDIVKVRLQTSSQYTGAIDAATKIWKNEGPLAFYKGTLTPLIGIGACVSVQFGGFHFARRYFEARNAAASSLPIPTSAPTAAAPPLTYTQYYLCGAFAGLTNSVLSGPIEHVRIRLQTQPHHPRLYSGPIDCIRTLVRKGGVGYGLYRGQAITLLREMQGYGVWFLSYEYFMNADVKRRGLAGRDKVETWRVAAYGGLAGECLWLASYPLDVIKSKMQTDGLIRATSASASASATAGARAVAGKAGEAAATEAQFGVQKYSSMRDCIAQVWRQEGMGGFFKGIGPTLLRAMPVSAATFAVAEITLRFIS